MKKRLLISLLLLCNTFIWAQFSTTPSPAIASGTVTLNFNKSGTPLATDSGTLYAHIGLTVNGARWQNVKGSWGNNSTQPALTLVSGTTYKLDLTPDLYTSFGVPTTSTITEICVVIRNSAGNQQIADTFFTVGAFQLSLNSPSENSTTIVNSGSNFSISATNTGGASSYTLKSNGSTIHATAATSNYSYTHNNLTTNQSYELVVSNGSTTITKKFTAVVNPGASVETMPTSLEDGINYLADATKAILVLDAPLKDFVYLAGSFNNYQPTAAYAMKKDPATGKFWITLSGLTSGTIYTYQYWVGESTPIANSPALVKTADPYSTLVLSPFDDPSIPTASYPNLPAYPQGQEREVTVLQTGQTAYAWSSASNNFVKPQKENLIVYEVLVRDFDSNRNFQDLINKMDYFKNLKINAIELLPIMEFEGNESWGYNTSFHMALDKYYGTSNKLKEFIDLCHQNGIAVILDVALNHAFGRNPMVRMWMNDPDGDGWGSPTAENPFFNTVAKHSYSVGEDFNHQSTKTQYYVERVIKQWIQEYKIDGFRWDLTKGFTQNCTASDESCTNAYQQDRVDVLQKYADYSWSLDPTHYTIFEHLGTNTEEQQWANYKINETPSKGIMMWGKMTDNYNELSMGYPSTISGMTSSSRGFAAHRLMGYAESHDEERLMYKNLQYGKSSAAAHNVKNLDIALSRMSAIGAVSLMVPGPKMIWHFGELGMENSIFSCNNGTVNTSSDATAGDCKLDTKPQPQWINNWLTADARATIYKDWAKMIALKTTEPVFLGTATLSNSASLLQNIKITNPNLATSQLKDVVIMVNFDVTTQSMTPAFPYTGTWYNLMDNTTINVSNTTDPITIAAGQFKIFGNKAAAPLSTPIFKLDNDLNLYPNPANASFKLNKAVSLVEVYDLTGKRILFFEGTFDPQHEFSISAIGSGLYLVKTTNESGQTSIVKLIKN